MVTTRACLAASVLLACSAFAAVPDYKLGDVAAEDVITPVPLLVVNPEATEALRQKVAQQVHLIVRHVPSTTAEAEADLRDKIVKARADFIVALETALGGRRLTEADVQTAAYERTLRAARQKARDLPFEKFAPLWVRGEGDEPLVAAMVQAVREVMVQPIVATKDTNVFPSGQSVRLLPLKGFAEAPAARELESGGTLMPSSRVLSVWRARRVAETSFPVGQEAIGKYAATFVRPNAVADPELTEVARAQRMDGVTVNDTYETGQVVVRKGQTIDRKALAALAAVREKSLIGTLQTKLEEGQSFAGLIMNQTKWTTAGLGLVVLVLCLILWRLRAKPSTALVLASSSTPEETAGTRAAGGDPVWRERALAAEGKAERAQQAIRSGVMGWMREKVVRSLSTQRADLLSAQQKAEVEIRELEQRLEQLHTPLQQRISAYEARIVELEKDLAAKGEENRELIGARISVARQQLMVERERSRSGQG
ncbi:MAG: hypothetical protein JNK23_19325 [Opitutaceae bacterium]|nr:hypothetical protein [Opitutaceae bacterium]